MSKAQIFNMTLNTLGISNPIENTESQDNKAILLNNYYDIARDYVLKDYDWNFASVYRQLSLLSLDNSLNEYTYCYDYPNDCICARELFQKQIMINSKFIIGSNEDSNKVIYTNCENAILRYTKRIENEAYYPSEFSMALSFYLASLTSSVITGCLQKGELAYQKYRNILKHARMLNAQEGVENPYSDDTYLDSRS